MTANSASLIPGTNTLSMIGTINPNPTDIAQTSDLFNRYLTSQKVAIVAKASTVASAIQVVNLGLQGLTLNTTLPPYGLPLVQSIDFVTMALNPASNTDVQMATTAVINLNSPLGPNALLQVTALTVAATLSTATGTQLGSFSSVGSVQGTTSTSVTTGLAGDIAVTSVNAFGSFIQSFVGQPSVALVITGSTTVSVTLSIGSLTLNAIPVNTTSTLAGNCFF
jgi:hypothetical protein